MKNQIEPQSTSTDRRDFIKMSAFSFFSLGLPKHSEKILNTIIQKSLPLNIGPIQRLTNSEFQSLDFNGDNINRPHDILWNINGYLAKKGGVPAPSEKRKVVIVGGGMSGLISAWKLRSMNPLLLEQDNFLGGNSKGEIINNSLFSIGAAYITVPDSGSEIEKFLQELNLMGELKLESAEETKISFQKKLMTDFWKGASDPARASEFIRVDEELKRIYNESFPDIPWTKESAISLEEFKKWDSMTFEKWLALTFGNVHPHVMEYFQLYCWSSFNASIDEISAAQALNFLAAEVAGVLALPGGNAAITQRIYERLNKMLSADSLRAGAMVLRVEAKKENEVWITYENLQGEIKTISAENCIVASPKFVAKHIVQDLPAEQSALFDKISYRAYIVANAIFEGNFESPAYDVYCLDGLKPNSPTPLNPPKRAFSDVCFGTWAANDLTKNGVLTIYKALPYDGARQFLFSPMAHDKHKSLILKDLPEFLNATGVDQSMMKGLRMTRWGHSIPVAQVNLLASGQLEKMNRPVKNSIFFANQDNWANPAFECAHDVAHQAALEISRR